MSNFYQVAGNWTKPQRKVLFAVIVVAYTVVTVWLSAVAGSAIAGDERELEAVPVESYEEKVTGQVAIVWNADGETHHAVLSSDSSSAFRYMTDGDEEPVAHVILAPDGTVQESPVRDNRIMLSFGLGVIGLFIGMFLSFKASEELL